MYPWFKALHLISMVAWFAGLFYIFRLFVYHTRHRGNTEMAATFVTMEHRLMYMIMHPAMAVTIVCGLLMLHLNPALMQQRWLHWKLLGVVALLAYQFYASYIRRQMAHGVYLLSETTCRIINEVPTVLLIVIVLLAVLKP